MKRSAQKRFATVISVSATIGVLALGTTAFAQATTPAPTTPQGGMHGGMMWGGGLRGRMSGVFGTVGAVSGTTLTVTSKAGPNGTLAAATYTVDASSASVMKAGASSSVSAIAVGDTVMVQGTVSGTSVTAKTIRDGVMPMGMGRGQKPPQSQNSIIKGNGQPVVGGSVTAISGSTLTVTNKSNVTYSVDASSAVVEKANATSSVSNIAVGDSVVVQGTVNGSSITASSVMDQGSAPTVPVAGTSQPRRGGMGGFFGAIGGFFQHLFGF